LLDGEVLAETVQNGRKLSIHIPPHGADTIILERQKDDVKTKEK
jgi:hypothetical protein